MLIVLGLYPNISGRIIFSDKLGDDAVVVAELMGPNGVVTVNVADAEISPWVTTTVGVPFEDAGTVNHKSLITAF